MSRLQIPEEYRPALRPPRFGLGTLLAGMAMFAGLFAIVHYFGLLGASLAVLFGLCVMAHVAGNALGTKLRQHGDARLTSDGFLASKGDAMAKPSPQDFAPLSRLHGRHSLGLHMLVITAIGAVAGSLSGFFGVEWLAEEKPEWFVLAIGSAACGVLGAIGTFAVASFLQVTLGELFQIRRGPRQRHDNADASTCPKQPT